MLKRAGFHDIPVRAAGIAAREIGRIVGGGEDDDRDCGEAGIGTESLQEVAAILAVEMKVEKNKRGQGRRAA